MPLLSQDRVFGRGPGSLSPSREGEMPIPPVRKRTRFGWFALALLCILDATRWLTSDQSTSVRQVLLARTIGCWLALMLVAGVTWQQTSGKPSLRAFSSASFSGALLFLATSLPDLLHPVLHLYALRTSDLLVVLPLSSVVICIASAAVRERSDTNLPGEIWPPLLSITGLLLLLPQPAVSNLLSAIVLLALPTTVGLAATWLGRGYMQPWWTGVGALCGAAVAATFLSISGRLVAETPEPLHLGLLVGQAGLEGLMLLLLVLSLVSLRSRRWSARFSITPLLLVLEGAVLMRPSWGTRQFVAVGLLLWGAASLLRPEPAATEA